MDIGTTVGNVILLGLLGLYLAWVIIENKKDWFDHPHRPARRISVLLACIGAIAVMLHVIGFNTRHIDLFWWSTPLLAFVSSFILGVAKPSGGIDTAYRFMTITAPATVLAGGFFVFLLLGQCGGCLLGFRLGETIRRLIGGGREQTRNPLHAAADIVAADVTLCKGEE